jgi:hypothetical protein
MPFESSYTQLHPEITAFAVQGLGAQDVTPPTTIIRADQAWRVHIEWQTTGLAAAVMAGVFHVSAYLESIGPGADLKLPIVPGPAPDELNVPLLSGAFTALAAPDFGRRDYSRNINVPAGQVPTDVDRSRAYKLVVAITYTEPTGAPGPMAGFREGPILQFYQP